MIDPRMGTLELTGALFVYGLLVSGRGPFRTLGTPDLGGLPLVAEFEVRGREGPRQVRTARGLLIGRSASAGIRLDEQTVSRVHARLECREGQVFVEDLGSRNGTLLNGRPVARDALLEPGDRVRIGSTEIVFLGVGEWK